MAVRLREADNMAAMAELQQQISELEIQVKPRVATPIIVLLQETNQWQGGLTQADTKPELLLTRWSAFFLLYHSSFSLIQILSLLMNDLNPLLFHLMMSNVHETS